MKTSSPSRAVRRIPPSARSAASLTLVLCASVLALSCTAAERPAGRGVTDDAIVIGTWAPLTGPAALWGAVGRGMQTYFEMINAEGGIHGRRLELVLKDDAYQPARTVAAVREMVERDGVFAIAGGVGTASGRAVLDYLMEKEVVWVSPASGATHWGFPPKKYLFAAYTPYFDEAAILVDHAVEELGRRRVAVVHQNDDFGQSGLVGAEIALAEHGLEVVEAVSVEVSDTDLWSHAVRLRESEADAVLMWLTPRHATILVGAVGRLGYQPQWLASSALSDTDLMHELTEGAWEGTVFASTGQLTDGDHPLMQKYRKAAARYGAGASESDFFYAGFRYAEPLVEGLRRAGRDLTTERLVAALETLDGWQGTGPPITYGPERRQGTRALFLARAGADGRAVQLTDWIESDIDIQEAIRRLGGSE